MSEKRNLSLPHFVRLLIPSYLDLPDLKVSFNLNYLLEAQSPNVVTLGDRASRYKFEGTQCGLAYSAPMTCLAHFTFLHLGALEKPYKIVTELNKRKLLTLADSIFIKTFLKIGVFKVS